MSADSRADGNHRRRARGLGLRIAGAAALIGMAVGVVAGATLTGHVGLLGQILAGHRGPVAIATSTSVFGMVESDNPGYPVALRECDIPEPAHVPQGCLALDHLADRSRVVIRCSDSTSPPPDPDLTHHYTSKIWYFVNEVDGSRPGLSGYIYSAEIPSAVRISAPACTPQLIAQYQDPKPTPSSAPPEPLRFRVTGTCTSADGTLTAVSSGFTPGGGFLIEASYPDGRPYPLDPARAIINPDGSIALPGTVAADGSVTWIWPCKGDSAGTYSTVAIDLASGRDTGWVSFTIGSASRPQGGGQPPASGTTTTVVQPTQAPIPPPTAPPMPTPPALHTEQEGHYGANTFTDPYNASGMGPNKIGAGAYVEVSCKVYAPAIQSANPDGYWYRIASTPWNGQYYSVANTFMNGDPWGGPYTHNTDWSVPDC